MSTDKPITTHIAGMNPEQVLALRAKFEAIFFPKPPEGPEANEIHRHNTKYREMIFMLREDGFSYVQEETSDAWEWFLSGVKEAMSALVPKESDSMQSLMLMRRYSSCFTKAFDAKEPVFVLRAQDITSTRALAQWLHTNKDLGESHPKYIAAKATLGQFESWPNRKKPD